MDIATQILQSINQSVTAQTSPTSPTALNFSNPTPEQQRLIEQIGKSLNETSARVEKLGDEIKTKLNPESQQTWHTVERMYKTIHKVFAQQTNESEVYETQKMKTR